MHKMHMFQDHQQPLVIMVEFDLLPPKPGQPQGQVQPIGTGVSKLFEDVLCCGQGAGKIKNNFSLTWLR